jgi:hypothetical protein
VARFGAFLAGLFAGWGQSLLVHNWLLIWLLNRSGSDSFKQRHEDFIRNGDAIGRETHAAIFDDYEALSA